MLKLDRKKTRYRKIELRGRKESDKAKAFCLLIYCLGFVSLLIRGSMFWVWYMNMLQCMCTHPQDYITVYRDVYIDFQFMAYEV